MPRNTRSAGIDDEFGCEMERKQLNSMHSDPIYREIARAISIGAGKRQRGRTPLIHVQDVAARLVAVGLQPNGISLSQLGYAVCGLASTVLAKCKRFLKVVEDRWEAMWTVELPDMHSSSSEWSFDSGGFSVPGLHDNDDIDGPDDLEVQSEDLEGLARFSAELNRLSTFANQQNLDNARDLAVQNGDQNGATSLEGLQLSTISDHRPLQARGAAMIEYTSTRPLPSLGIALHTVPPEPAPSTGRRRLDVGLLEASADSLEIVPYTPGRPGPDPGSSPFDSSLDLDPWFPPEVAAFDFSFDDSAPEAAPLVDSAFSGIDRMLSQPRTLDPRTPTPAFAGSVSLVAGENALPVDRWANRDRLLQQPLPVEPQSTNLPKTTPVRSRGLRKKRKLEPVHEAMEPEGGSGYAPTDSSVSSGSESSDSESSDSQHTDSEHTGSETSGSRRESAEQDREESRFDTAIVGLRRRMYMRSAFDVETKLAPATQPFVDFLSEHSRARRAQKQKKKTKPVFDIKGLKLNLRGTTFLIDALKAPPKPILVAPRASRRRRRPSRESTVDSTTEDEDETPQDETIDVAPAFAALHSSDIDNVMRGGGGDSAIADDVTHGLIRMPPAAGRVFELDDVFATPLPVLEDESEDASKDFATQVVAHITANEEPTTFKRIYEDMSHRAEFSHYKLGDFVRALTRMDKQIVVSQDHALSCSEPIYIRLQ